jgi:hypothetical protein
MDKKHIKDRKLNDSLVRTGADSVERARKVPLRRAVELGLPDHRSEDEQCGDEQHRTSADFHRKRDPKDVGKAL